MGWESLVGLMSVQISVDPSTGFSVTGMLQWEAFRSSWTGLPALLTYSLSVSQRVCAACDSGILGTGLRAGGSELVSVIFPAETRNCMTMKASFLRVNCAPRCLLKSTIMSARSPGAISRLVSGAGAGNKPWSVPIWWNCALSLLADASLTNDRGQKRALEALK